MKRTNISTGTKYEPIIGYSRAVRVGDTGTVPARRLLAADGNLVGVGDAYTQTMQALRNIESALHKADARLEDVVRTRMFVANIAEWEKIGRAQENFSARFAPRRRWCRSAGWCRPKCSWKSKPEAIVTSRAAKKPRVAKPKRRKK